MPELWLLYRCTFFVFRSFLKSPFCLMKGCWTPTLLCLIQTDGETAEASHPLLSICCTSTCSRRHLFQSKPNCQLLFWSAVSSSAQSHWGRISVWKWNWNSTWSKKEKVNVAQRQLTLDASLHPQRILIIISVSCSVFCHFNTMKKEAATPIEKRKFRL